MEWCDNPMVVFDPDGLSAVAAALRREGSDGAALASRHEHMAQGCRLFTPHAKAAFTRQRFISHHHCLGRMNHAYATVKPKT